MLQVPHSLVHVFFFSFLDFSPGTLSASRELLFLAELGEFFHSHSRAYLLTCTGAGDQEKKIGQFRFLPLIFGGFPGLGCCCFFLLFLVHFQHFV